MVTVFDDVTRQRQMKEQLRHQADHDSLTGVFNRRRFDEEVSASSSTPSATPGRSSLMMDLDTFKFVNDSYGHPSATKFCVTSPAPQRNGPRDRRGGADRRR